MLVQTTLTGNRVDDCIAYVFGVTSMASDWIRFKRSGVATYSVQDVGFPYFATAYF